HVVRGSHELVHQEAGFVEPALACQSVDQPERAREERTLLAHDTVLALVSVEERAGAELAPDGVDRSAEAIAFGLLVAEDRHREEARVELVHSRSPDVAPAVRVPAFAGDERADLVGFRSPEFAVVGDDPALAQPAGAVERDPAERLRLDEVRHLAPDLPD